MTPLQLLLIEDEVLIAENMKYSLLDLGYEVVQVCNNFDDAATAIQSQHFDLAILDINLGDRSGRTGLDLAAMVKEQKQAPFIFITAYSDLDTISTASRLQPSAYLVKPVNDKTLFSTIQVAFQNHSVNQAASKPEAKNEETAYFFVKTGTKNYKIHWKDVYHIRALKNYVEIQTKEHPQTHLIRTSLSQFMDSLLPENIKSSFLKINRSEAILYSAVKNFSREKVFTDFGEFDLTNDAYTQLEKKCSSVHSGLSFL